MGDNMLLMCVILILAIAATMGQIARADEPALNGSYLRIASFNMAHGRGLAESQIGLPRSRFRENIDSAAMALLHKDVTIVAIQEADGPSAWSGRFDHVDHLATAAKYPHKYHGRHLDVGIGPARIAYGTAILSRLPLCAQETHRFVLNPTLSKGFVTAEVEWEGRRLLIASVHLFDQSKEVRLEQAHELVKTLNAVTVPIVLAGDFNCAWKDSDDALHFIAENLKLRAYEPLSPDDATFPSGQPLDRLDWILLSNELRFAGYCTWSDLISDHRIVAADIQWLDQLEKERGE